MSELGPDLLRRLAEWDPGDVPITSIHLTVDGGRYPRRSDYELRLAELLRRARELAVGLGRDAERSVSRDAGRMEAFVREEFERADTRGLAMFSAHDARLWAVARVPRPVFDRAAVGPEADLMPLESVLETYRPTCLALADYEKARVFLAELGDLQEVDAFRDEVPGRHDQGGFAQARMQRHVDDHRERHVRRVAEELFALSRRRPFEHLILAGPGEAHRQVEAYLHDYLRRRLRASIGLSMTASRADVQARMLEVAEQVERVREREAVERLTHATSTNDHGVSGLEDTLSALAEGRVAELMASIALSVPGRACVSCGRLVTAGARCPTCGSALRDVPDVVEAAVAAALRTGARVETVTDDALEPHGGIGAVLRF